MVQLSLSLIWIMTVNWDFWGWCRFMYLHVLILLHHRSSTSFGLSLIVECLGGSTRALLCLYFLSFLYRCISDFHSAAGQLRVLGCWLISLDLIYRIPGVAIQGDFLINLFACSLIVSRPSADLADVHHVVEVWTSYRQDYQGDFGLWLPFLRLELNQLMTLAEDIGLLRKIRWYSRHVAKIMSKCLLVHREEYLITVLFLRAQPDVCPELVEYLLALSLRWGDYRLGGRLLIRADRLLRDEAILSVV